MVVQIPALQVAELGRFQVSLKLNNVSFVRYFEVRRA